jgi:AcrR family transcriptional regulator
MPDQTTHKTRGRKPNLERRDALLRAASDCLAERGYAATTMRDIAARAEISVSLLQKYFPTKRTIADAFLERAVSNVRRFIGEIEALDASTPSTLEFLKGVGSEYLRYVRELRGFYLTWIVDLSVMGPRTHEVALRAREVYATIATALERRLGITAGDAIFRARAFLGALFSFAILSPRIFLEPEVDAEEDYIARLARLALTTEFV